MKFHTWRMESSFCVCLTPAISVLQSVPRWCRKEHKKNQVKKEPKSRPMMNLIARSNERAPSALSSTAPESPEKSRHESRSPLSSQAEKYDRTGKPVCCRDTSHERHRPAVYEHSSTYSEWNVAKNWSSQELKSDGLMDDRTVRPVVCPQGGAHQFVIEDAERNQNCRSDPDHSCTRWTIKCEKGKNNPQ